MSLSAQEKITIFLCKLEDVFLQLFSQKNYLERSDQSNYITWFNSELHAMREHKNFDRKLYNQYKNEILKAAPQKYRER